VKYLNDNRSNQIAIVCHCIANVHSLEDGLAEYPGLEEEVMRALIDKGFGIVQLRCPETRLHGIERLPMPKDTYDKPHIRDSYRKQAEEEILQLKEFVKKGAGITVVIGAEASPSCGVTIVGKWKDGVPVEVRQFPRDVNFVQGRGVYMEELEKLFKAEGIEPKWIGIPGKSTKKVFPVLFEEAVNQIKEL
jgi:predicted secreted protein